MKKFFISFVFIFVLAAGIVFTVGANAATGTQAPTLISPENNSTYSISPTLSWYSVSEASGGYKIKLTNSSGKIISFSGTETVSDSIYSGTATTATSTTVGTDLAEGTYSWAVSSCSPVADAEMLNCGTWSETWTFAIATTSSTTITPTITTNSATNINTGKATLNATVNPNGNSTTVLFELGISQDIHSSFYNTTSTQSVGSGVSLINVSLDVSSLSSSTTYYFRAVAQNSQGITYGSNLSFTTNTSSISATTPTITSTTTLTTVPSVTTNGATSITSNSAKLNSTINPNGSSADAWFEYGTSSSTLDKSTVSQNIGSASSYSSVSAAISGLSTNTYYFRPVAKNSTGTTYGETRSFTIESGTAGQEVSSTIVIPTTSSETGYSNGDIVKSISDFKVYVIVNGKKLHITDSKTFSDWGYNWSQVKEISQEKLGEFSEITLSSYLVRAEGDTKIYRIIGDKKVWIPSIKAFLDSGYKSNSEMDISKDVLDNFADAKYIRHKGGKKVWEIKDGKKYFISDSNQIPAQDIKTITLAEFLAYPIGK